MKILRYAYMLMWILVIPPLIGVGVANALLEIYLNFNRHLLAGMLVCFFSAAVVTWMPMVFIVEGVGFPGKGELSALTLLLWIAGAVAPVLFGFDNLYKTISVLLIFSAAMTATKLVSALSEIADGLKRFQDHNSS